MAVPSRSKCDNIKFYLEFIVFAMKLGGNMVLLYNIFAIFFYINVFLLQICYAGLPPGEKAPVKSAILPGPLITRPGNSELWSGRNARGKQLNAYNF